MYFRGFTLQSLAGIPKVIVLSGPWCRLAARRPCCEVNIATWVHGASWAMEAPSGSPVDHKQIDQKQREICFGPSRAVVVNRVGDLSPGLKIKCGEGTFPEIT